MSQPNPKFLDPNLPWSSLLRLSPSLAERRNLELNLIRSGPPETSVWDMSSKGRPGPGSRTWELTMFSSRAFCSTQLAKEVCVANRECVRVCPHLSLRFVRVPLTSLWRQRMRSVLIPSLLMATVACQAPMWFKAGATQDDFARDKYACAQETQQPVSAARVDRRGGESSSRIATNVDLFKACMNARGYYETRPGDTPPRTGEVTQSSEVRRQQAQKRFADAKDTIRAISDETRLACSKIEFQALYEKSACQASSLTLAQLTNTDKISDEDRPMLLKLSLSGKERAKRLAAAFASVGDKTGRELSLLTERTEERNQQNALALYERKITWGEFSKARQEISSSYREESARLTSSK